MVETTGPFPLEEGTIYLLEGDLHGSPAEVDASLAILSPAERTRAARFRYYRHRRRYVIAHARLRQTLSRVTGERPEAFRFQLGKHGKPYLMDGPSFNLSHSGERFLLGMSTSGRIGVDLEEERPVREMVALAKKKFSSEEVEVFLAAPEIDRTRVFFRIWTLKEAYLKGIGTGLATRLDSFAVNPQPGETNALVRIDDPAEVLDAWFVRNWAVGGSAHAAVAIDRPRSAVVALP